MRNKLLKGIAATVLTLHILFTGGIPIFAAASNRESAVNEAESVIDGILEHNLERSGVNSIQGWIDGALTQTAGTTSEWYVIALSQYGRYDFSQYEKSLSDYLDHTKVTSASTRQKYALALIAGGSEDGYIQDTLCDSIGEQGIMSLIFGLHILNNGYISSRYDASDVIGQLLALQCADGGWALTGQYGDVDVTAMTLQALAPYSAEHAVKESVDSALNLLSERQLEDGDYASYGVANPESTAQVMIALSALGIDPMQDERFIKNDQTLLDGINKYRLSDGSYCHTQGGLANENATSQVFCAMIAYIRLLRGEGSLYLFGHISDEDAPPIADEDKPADTQPSTPAVTTQPEKEHSNTDTNSQSDLTFGNEQEGSYKIWVCLAIVGGGCVLCIMLFLKGKRHFKNYIAVIVAVAVSIALICVTNIQSADDYYNGEGTLKDNAVGTVKLTIRCDKAVGSSDSDYIPEDGVILEMTEFEIEDGDTVYDILIEAARKYNIQIENNGNDKLAYIVGINHLYEFDLGDLSGWVFLVNGTQPSVGCSEYRLTDGDSIEWHYSLALGNDIE